MGGLCFHWKVMKKAYNHKEMKIIKKDHVLNGTDNIYNVENFYSVVVKNKRYIKLSFYF